MPVRVIRCWWYLLRQESEKDDGRAEKKQLTSDDEDCDTLCGVGHVCMIPFFALSPMQGLLATGWPKPCAVLGRLSGGQSQFHGGNNWKQFVLSIIESMADVGCSVQLTPELYESLYKKGSEAWATSFKVSSNIMHFFLFKGIFRTSWQVSQARPSPSAGQEGRWALRQLDCVVCSLYLSNCHQSELKNSTLFWKSTLFFHTFLEQEQASKKQCQQPVDSEPQWKSGMIWRCRG